MPGWRRARLGGEGLTLKAMAPRPSISVVIPAHNAETTLADTLGSLLVQTYSAWEAIVVDDGSNDSTGEVAAEFTRRDARIRRVSQTRSGEGAARNSGIEHARFDWLLFLDADDWLRPQALERLGCALAADLRLDAVYGGWVRVAPGGEIVGETYWPKAGGLFAVLARFCAFAIHSCVVRRALVEEVGRFDPSLQTCADWDLWQRVARAGARFGAVREVLACYRMRPGSASANAWQLYADGLCTIALGHSRDPRVRNPDPKFAQGAPAEGLAGARLGFACWIAGLLLGRGEDARAVLDPLAGDRDPTMSPRDVAHSVFKAALLPSCRPTSAWTELWPRLEPGVEDFLRALEHQSSTSGLARAAQRALERLIIEHATAQWPLAIGATHAMRIEVSAPIRDAALAPEIERLHCLVEIESERVGSIELPVCDGLVRARVIADAIAADLAWPILGRFFARTLYRELDIRRDAGSISIWRGDLCIAERLPVDEGRLGLRLHDDVGWTAFLQELWGRPGWARDRFYAWEPGDEAAPVREVDADWVAVEVSEELSDLIVAHPTIAVAFTVGGVPVGLTTVGVEEGRLPASRLRAALVAAGGYEMCRAAVREGILGVPLSPGLPLRARLRAAAATTRTEGTTAPAGVGGVRSVSPASVVLVPGWEDALERALPDGEPGIVIARRAIPAMDSSVSRRAQLPAAAAHDLLDAAAVAAEPVVDTRGDSALVRVVYAPDLLWRSSHGGSPEGNGESGAGDRGPEVVVTAPCEQPAPEVAARFVTRCSAVTKGAPETDTERLSILMYRRVAPAGAAATARYRLSPGAFEDQLRYLQDTGFYGIDLETWHRAVERHDPLPGRAVLLTFDDGYADFEDHAWPLLERYGYAATVFVVAEYVGQVNRWDAALGEELPLLAWDAIRRLQAQGVRFGSHSATHPRLTALSPAEVTREAARSRAVLQRGLGTSVTAFAYPYGAEDAVVRHLVGACGYVYGLTSRPGRSGLWEPLLALPRIEVLGSDTLADFINKLNGDGG